MNKAVILARGLGTRMRKADSSVHLAAEQQAVAETGLKAMIPMGRPFLNYVLRALADAGFQEACLVIGPEHQGVVHYYSVDAPPKWIQTCFAVQEQPRGTADAVLSAEEFASDEDFLCINSDNYYPVPVLQEMRIVGEPAVALFDRHTLVTKGNISDEKIRKFAICEVGEDGYLRAIIEKPLEHVWASSVRDPLVSMNCWRFSSPIFEVCRHTPLSPRGEYELPVAVGEAIRRFGMRFRAVQCYEGVLDLSSRADIALVAERLKDVPAEP